MEHRAKIVGIALLCVAFGSEALTLGRVRGAVLVGQTLNLVVPVQSEAGEDLASSCFDAEVFHADTRQAAARVRVLVEASPQAPLSQLRILSSALVDEPVVTVYLRSGCDQKTTRRYVLLAEMPSDMATASVPPTPPAAALPSTASTASTASLASRSVPAAAPAVVKPKTPRAPQPARRPKVVIRPAQATLAPVSFKTATPETNNTAARSSGQPRLKLDPLEFLSDRIANLEAPAPITTPQDTLRNMQRIQTLEASLKALLASAANHEASLTDLKNRLQKAESARFPGAVIYVLIALVLACLAALAWLWNRQRGIQSGSDWWSDSIMAPAALPLAPEPLPDPAARYTEPDAPPLPQAASSAAMAALAHPAEPASMLDVHLIDMSDSRFDDFMRPEVVPREDREAPISPAPQPVAAAGPARSFNFESMPDIRQQAEFFVALGQPEQALQILKRQVDASEKPNPFVFLDLLSLVHSLDQKTEFQQLRENFGQVFNARVPEFALFKEEGKELASYPDVLLRIVALWPTSEVLAALDACIFVNPRDGARSPFDLAAFRELLLLHAIAHSVVPVSDAPADLTGIDASPRSFVLASGAPDFSDSGYVATVRAGLPGAVAPPIKLPQALDLDLSGSEMMELSFPPVSAPPAGRSPLTPLEPLDSGNLIDFDLPESPPQPGSSGYQPGR